MQHVRLVPSGVQQKRPEGREHLPRRDRHPDHQLAPAFLRARYQLRRVVRERPKFETECLENRLEFDIRDLLAGHLQVSKKKKTAVCAAAPSVRFDRKHRVTRYHQLRLLKYGKITLKKRAWL